ncbi:unnamed protein product [Heterobilharzia americana]|nr:unnamed protein product [Heterobilharzia americana]
MSTHVISTGLSRLYVKDQLINLFNRSSTCVTLNSMDIFNSKNIYLQWSVIIRSFEIAEKFWLKKLHQIQLKRKDGKSLRSGEILRREEDRLAETAISYGLINAYRVKLPISQFNDTVQQNTTFNCFKQILSSNEKYLYISSAMPIIYEDDELVKSEINIFPKISWNFIHRLLREIHVRNLEVIDSQLIKYNLRLLTSTINWHHCADNNHHNKIDNKSDEESVKSLSSSLSSELTASSSKLFPTLSSDMNEQSMNDANNSQNHMKEMTTDYNIPDKFKVYLSEQNLISTSINSCQYDTYQKVIQLTHFFPYSDEQINSYSRDDRISKVLDDHLLHNVEEWSLFDLSDQPLENLTTLYQHKALQLLDAYKSVNCNDRKLFVEKASMEELSPGIINNFSLCSTEVYNELDWSHIWRMWCRTSYERYMIINCVWNKILKELEKLLPMVMEQTWELLNQWCSDIGDNSSTNSNYLSHYKNAFYHQCINNLIALISGLFKKYFSKQVWEFRKTGRKSASVYQSSIALIDHFWPKWKNIEDQPKFYELLIRNLFLFSFIWGIGGSMAGDPRIRTRFNILRVSDIDWNNESEENEQGVHGLKNSLFNCIVDLRTGQLTPFWHTDSLDLHWPEEYDTIIPETENSNRKPLLPTLYHLSVHLFTGSLLIQSGRPVIITGPFGSGKSQLAIAISQNSEMRKSWIKSTKNKIHSFRMQSVDFMKKLSLTFIQGDNISRRNGCHEKLFKKSHFKNNTIILEDVHLISKTSEAQRMWNQGLRHHLTANNPLGLNYSSFSSKSNEDFIPILTTLDDHQFTKTYLNFPKIKRYFAPLLPQYSNSQWFFTNLSKSVECYLVKSSPVGHLIPISYLLFGPVGSLFLNSKFTRQSLLNSAIHHPVKPIDVSSSTTCYYNSDGVAPSSTIVQSHFTPISSLTTTSSISNNSASVYSFTNLSSSTVPNSDTSSVSANVGGSFPTSVASSSNISLLTSCTTTNSTLCQSNTNISYTSNDTSISISSSSKSNSHIVLPSIDQLFNVSSHKKVNSTKNFSSVDHNEMEFNTQLTLICSKLNDETETVLSNQREQTILPFFRRYNANCKIIHKAGHSMDY